MNSIKPQMLGLQLHAKLAIFSMVIKLNTVKSVEKVLEFCHKKMTGTYWSGLYFILEQGLPGTDVETFLSRSSITWLAAKPFHTIFQNHISFWGNFNSKTPTWQITWPSTPSATYQQDLLNWYLSIHGNLEGFLRSLMFLTLFSKWCRFIGYKTIS